ncbi:MAG: dephospho-CoA kinase [Muribaculaceae bacterium]|nr:dephospho-CoA kinase [Muribaculaceae bacterium]
MKTEPRLIAITGGIGAGKSVVSNVLRALGYKVYDSDSEAKRLMDTSENIKNDLSTFIDKNVVDDNGTIDRKKLADIVFNDADKLLLLNKIVHAAVRDDIREFTHQSQQYPVFVETAILYQSEIDRMVDAVWDVTAPVDVRICRVMKRNSLTAEHVKARIESQQFTPENPHPNLTIIINDDKTAVLPQIERLIAEL